MAKEVARLEASAQECDLQRDYYEANLMSIQLVGN
jgi:hypothetical protein